MNATSPVIPGRSLGDKIDDVNSVADFEAHPGMTTDETFSRHQRYGRMTQPDTWYVAFGPDKAVKTDDSATGLVRSTKTFKSEVDAKLFAMQILAKGWSATAGTLNPHQPKQIVGSSQIERWADPGLGG
jgi:hypothetical protein